MTLTPVHLNACCHTSYDTVIPVDCIAAISTAVVTIRLAPPQYSCHTSTSYYSRSVIPVHLLQYSCHTSPFCCCYSRSVLPAHLVTATVHYVIPLQLISALVHLSPVHPITATGQLSYQSTLSYIGYSTCYTSPPYHRLQYMSYQSTLPYIGCSTSHTRPLNCVCHTSPSYYHYSTSFIPVHPVVATVHLSYQSIPWLLQYLSYQSILWLLQYFSHTRPSCCFSGTCHTSSPQRAVVGPQLHMVLTWVLQSLSCHSALAQRVTNC